MERQPIRELQGYLRLLSQEKPSIPQLKQDGIFGSLTTQAVREFQRQFELEATGVVDFTTWSRIYQAYRIADLKRHPAHHRVPFPAGEQIIGMGDRGNEVAFIQILLNGLSEAFDNIEPITTLGVYEEKTEKNIRQLQQLSGLTETGAVDAQTWNALLNAYEALQSGLK